MIIVVPPATPAAIVTATIFISGSSNGISNSSIVDTAHDPTTVSGVEHTTHTQDKIKSALFKK